MKKKIKKIKNNLRVSNYSGYRVCYNGSIKIERYKTSQTENKGCDQNRYCRKGKKGNVMFKMFALDFENETIVCSKKALRAASNPTTAEYKALMKMKKLQPTFKVVAREIETNEKRAFDDYCYKLGELYSISEKHYFIIGFRMGAHIMFDLMGEYKGDLIPMDGGTE